MSFFESVEGKPEDPILGLALAFAEDGRSKKVNLGIGTYKNDEGKPQLLSSVKKAEAILLEKNLNKEYPPILGDPEFVSASLELIFGAGSSLQESGKAFGAQTLGGTGALRVGAELLARTHVSHTIYISDPTWLNHEPIFTKAGLKVDVYPYYDAKGHSLNIAGMLEAVRRMPKRSTLLLQPCCHNPTGLDPDVEVWKELSALMKKRNLLPFFDCAYLGFDRDIEADASVMRRFAADGHEMLVAFSYSKNFGLYGERVGALAVTVEDAAYAKNVAGQLKQVVRGSYSMPPLHGQRIVTTILRSADLRSEWLKELAGMRERIQGMRKALVAKLKAKGGGARFDSIAKQTGLFSYTGLDEGHVQRLRQDYGIYFPKNGRINAAGLNAGNIDYVVDSILAVL